ncbi:xylulokinase [Actinocorallia herbida]|uniref:Xylulokinase n=1 Tax=Actinocorallia herbida TaxID=58109 RepID=A0A3N1CTD8_9ACTN|nr:FGGY family carbohydrate kinase [Actinocorallia herbida]ROO84434.1 xylulokinase [Actinocorallia herbida]
MSAIAFGIDVGTTGVKGVALDVERGIVAEAGRGNALGSPRPGWAEADPGQWSANVADVLAELASRIDVARVVGVATTGMVPAVVCLDASGRPLRKAILQNDARAVTEVAEVGELLRDADVLRRTGSPVTQQSVAPTTRWLRTHEPDVWDRTATVLGSYDAVLTGLGARPHVELNWAIESGLFDLDGRPFGPAVAAGGVGDRLPPVASGGTVVGELSAAASARTGLPQGIPLVVGGADHVLSAYGAGLTSPGDWLVKLGGAGDILAVSAEPVSDDRFYLDRHPVDGLWLPNGCMATSGSLVRWVQALLGEDDLASLDDGASRREAASLLCLPYFLGEKTPLNDPLLRGVFAGLHLGHDRHDLHRAALEGIAFGFRHNADVLRARGIALTTASITNGGATSALWKQIHADVLGTPLRTLRDHPGAALGAAVAAAVGGSALPGWQAIDAFVRPGPVIDPNPVLTSRYDDAYRQWRALGEATAPTMRALSRGSG